MNNEHRLQAAPALQDKDESIYQALMTAIVEHQLPPGSKLPEEALAEVFAVSRTGIRKVLQRLAAVQLVTLTPKRGAHVTSPSVEESQAIFRTRALLEVANLPDVIARCQPPHLAALENIIQREQQAHEAHDGPAAIRHSADFHIQLQAISGNPVLTEMVTRLSQRSSLVIAAWGAPWRQGCRCDDHQQLVGLLRDKALQLLSEALMHHFDHIVASLCFERDGVSLPIFPGCSPVTRSRDVFCLYTSDQPQHQPGDDRNDRRRRARGRRAGHRDPCGLSRAGVPSIEGHFDEAIAAVGVLEQIKAGREQGVDGHVIACFGDPGLLAARELAQGPVIGIAEAAMHMATMVATRFSIVTTLPRTLIIARHLLHQYGFHQHCAALHAIDLPVLALEDGSGLAQEKVRERCIRALKEDGSGR